MLQYFHYLQVCNDRLYVINVYVPLHQTTSDSDLIIIICTL